jgi:hypothetical protein
MVTGLQVVVDRKKKEKKTHQQNVSWHEEPGNAVCVVEKHGEMARAAARGMATWRMR